MMTRFQFPFIFLLVSDAIHFAEALCPDGSISSFSGTFCYLLVSSPMDFINSENYCANFGGHLASVHNVFDNLDLTDKAQKVFLTADEFAIGGNKLQKPGVWSWTNDSPFDYTDWASGEPLNTDARQCLHVDLGRGQWYAADCTVQVPFVCQVNSSSTLPPTTTKRPTTVPMTRPITTTPKQPSTATLPGKPCVGVVFVEEMTETIGQQRKEIFLNATKMMAADLHDIYLQKLQFGLGLTGRGILWPIQLQDFSTFDNTLASIISTVTNKNEPNSAESFYQPILSALLKEIQSKHLDNYVVLLMGETEQMQDFETANALAQQIAKTNANVFVLDATENDFTNENVFSNLVRKDPSKITKWSKNSTPQSLANDLSSVLMGAVQMMSCK